MAVPSAVVTESFPVTASGGTVAIISVYEDEMTVALAEARFTEVGFLRLVPLMVIFPPGTALSGIKLSIFGRTLNTAVLVTMPVWLVTLMSPLVAPKGTVAFIEVDETTLKLALTPLKFTPVTAAE